MKTFAAIDVGSYELCMQIYEISPKIGLRKIDSISKRIALGIDSYNYGKIGNERLDDLCEALSDFRRVMESYKVDAYRAYGTSAIREIQNTQILLDQIKNRTGITVETISNSEQRFLHYKAVATKGQEFYDYLGGGTAILDIGGSSIQISLFENDALVTTQNMRLGVMRMREQLDDLGLPNDRYEKLLGELVQNQFSLFKKLYIKGREIKNLIVIDDYLTPVMEKSEVANTPTRMNETEFVSLMDQLTIKNHGEVSKWLQVSEEHASLLFHSAFLTKEIMKVLGVDNLWAPGATLCDGIVYEYATAEKMLSDARDFEKDIIASTTMLGKRFMCSKKRNEFMAELALEIFDAMKKVHGLSKRERLLLQIAALLNDCGKYISQTEVGDCSFQIIMGTEIIGLSHAEREIVAYVAKYNRDDFDYYEELSRSTSLSKEAYLVIAKLTAILRVANGLDRSHKQKFKDVRVQLKENKLTISVDTQEDITLEKGLLTNRAQFFEEVYNVRPVVKQRKKF